MAVIDVTIQNWERVVKSEYHYRHTLTEDIVTDESEVVLDKGTFVWIGSNLIGEKGVGIEGVLNTLNALNMEFKIIHKETKIMYL